MPAYVDTSALVKRYVAEVGSAWVRRLLAHPAQYVIYTSALSPVEVISARQRRVRAGALEMTQAHRLWAALSGGRSHPCRREPSVCGPADHRALAAFYVGSG